ncbi:MAG: flagellar hook capping protein [Pirellulaceae bacterium]|nr:flagellar hook capping protein [Pirellulaceae bacterium]
MNGITSQVATVDYLQLLTVQLQNQDPIDPVDQEGLINDLTQFSILEGIEGMNTSFADMMKLQEMSQGSSLLGKTASYVDSLTGEAKSGQVTEMLTGQDSISLLVDGESVALDDIVSVTNS